MVAKSLVVLVIAQSSSGALTSSFERAARGVLGHDADIRLEALAEDPPDDQSEARAKDADGVVELSLAADGRRARVHCFVARDARWVDREFSFGPGVASPEREAAERGRLLGFAVATMFTDEAEPPPREPKPEPPPTSAPTREADSRAREAAARPKVGTTTAASSDSAPREAPPSVIRASGAASRSLEFAGLVSSGIGGTASAVGAEAALRMPLVGLLSARVVVAGRAGNIPAAQASTRNLLLGGGLAVALLPAMSPWELGVRVDALASYFQASHLSEDDVEPATRSRWLAAGDLVLEGGFRFTGSAGLFAGGGVEAAAGHTEIFTHGQRVAVVPALRAVAETGFRARF